MNILSPNPSDFRACEYCVHGETTLDGHACNRTGELVSEARAEGGSCGAKNPRHFSQTFVDVQTPLTTDPPIQLRHVASNPTHWERLTQRDIERTKRNGGTR